MALGYIIHLFKVEKWKNYKNGKYKVEKLILNDNTSFTHMKGLIMEGVTTMVFKLCSWSLMGSV